MRPLLVSSLPAGQVAVWSALNLKSSGLNSLIVLTAVLSSRAYVHWIRAFIRFHGCRAHPREMGAPEVEAFLTWLAAERHVSVSTHGQALSALLFLYQKVLVLDLPWLQSIGRPRRQPRLPTVLSQDEVARVLLHMSGTHRLVAQLLYGTGMRITEALNLRVKDLDFERRTLIVRCGKGGKDQLLMLPAALVPALREQLARARLLWAADREAQRPGVEMPDALDRKYLRAGISWTWFWVLPQDDLSVDPRSGAERRHHLYDDTFQRAFKRAAFRGGGVRSPLDMLAALALPAACDRGGAMQAREPAARYDCELLAA